MTPRLAFPMSDWSYQTVFRPLLFRMSPTTARDFALGSMGLLSRLPLGPRLIDFLGHMRPGGELRTSLGAVAYASPVGIGGPIDARLLAPAALARFGAGFLEVGPITVEPVAGGRVTVNASDESIVFDEPRENPGVETALKRLRSIDVPVFARIALDAEALAGDATDISAMIGKLDGVCAGFILDAGHGSQATEAIARAASSAREAGARMLFAAVFPDSVDAASAALRDMIAAGRVDGVVLDGRDVDDSGRHRWGKPCFAGALDAVRRLRAALPPGHRRRRRR